MSKDLTTGSVTGHLWRLAAPASLGMFFETMFNFVDTYWAGTLSTTALAALSVSFPIFFLIISLTQGLFTAASALASYHWGEKNSDAAKSLGKQVLYYALLASAILTAGGLTVQPYLFSLLSVDGLYLDYANQYMSTIFCGSTFFVFGSGVNGLLIAHGNSRVMRNALVGGFFLNCILDPWFLHGGWGLPAMGVQGIALATLLVKFLSVVYVLVVAFQEKLLTPRLAPPQLSVLFRILRHAVPASMSMLTIASGIFVTNYFIKPYGIEAVGAFGICLRIEQIFLLPVIGLTFGLLAISGQNYGAKQLDRVQSAHRQALGVGLTLMTVGAALELTVPERLVGMLTDDPEVITIGAEYLRVAAVISWAYPLMSLSDAVLQGLQRPFFVLSMGLMRQFILRMLVFYLIVSFTSWGLLGLWWSIFAINWLSALVTLAYVHYALKQRQP